jgi:3'-phosphoadenosine 5'-phosphosulfate sulfotransferase
VIVPQPGRSKQRLGCHVVRMVHAVIRPCNTAEAGPTGDTDSFLSWGAPTRKTTRKDCLQVAACERARCHLCGGMLG